MGQAFVLPKGRTACPNPLSCVLFLIFLSFRTSIPVIRNEVCSQKKSFCHSAITYLSQNIIPLINHKNRITSPPENARVSFFFDGRNTNRTSLPIGKTHLVCFSKSLFFPHLLPLAAFCRISLRLACFPNDRFPLLPLERIDISSDRHPPLVCAVSSFGFFLKNAFLPSSRLFPFPILPYFSLLSFLQILHSLFQPVSRLA